MRIIESLVASSAVFIGMQMAAPALAQYSADPGKTADARPDTAKDLTEGEIRKLDKETGKVTIKHGEIKNLSMPGMTMVFDTRDKSLLENVKAGDKIRFRVISENGKMIVTELHPEK